YETTTCSFLHRDFSGNYKFIHKSFMEYFIAEYLFYCLGKKTNCLLRNSKINQETRFFLRKLYETWRSEVK
ncbi:hypothetical protein QUF50_08850, partial [Thiotrichales bacterium HSG1]|nr:hypothetical protein [Thiotrichales bacterium HSG1]